MDRDYGGSKARGEPYVQPEPAAANSELLGNELAQIAHDLKNPLSSIALETELLDARGVSCDGCDARQAMARIRRNVRFLDRMIYDLVDACTLHDGRFALRRARVELSKLLATVVERVVPHSERHRVVVEAQRPIEALVDELRIERVVANLLDNALKYTPSDAQIAAGLTQDSTTNSATVSISDSGPGLMPAEIALLFQPYRRGANVRGRTGSGLGLYVSKQIVEAHGGRIGVESVTGAGARFYFALPLA